MNYVISDLHGEYELYQQMLSKIKFSKEDMLYVLGDVLDRGPEPIKILQDMMRRPNVVFIAGNHEHLAAECLPFLMREITEESIADMNTQIVQDYMLWQTNGSDTTINAFRKLNKKTQQEILEYIVDAEIFEEVQVADKTFILVHAGLGNFHKDKDLFDYELEELIWERPDYNIPYYTDHRYVVMGHTPTMCIDNNPKPGYIYHNNHHIVIDCGCCVENGRLGCIRLEDGAEFYIEKT